jgi:hypothetical protein
MTEENWLPVVGAEGMYSISDQGRARSEDRIVMDKGNPSRRKGKILKPQPNSKGYLRVWITNGVTKGQRFIHHMVLESFEGERPEGLWVLHKDDDNSNNAWSNLYYGTPSQNMDDLIRNGNHHQLNKTECPYGHKYTPENTLRNGPNGRGCRECGRKRGRDYMKRRYWERKSQAS